MLLIYANIASQITSLYYIWNNYKLYDVKTSSTPVSPGGTIG